MFLFIFFIWKNHEPKRSEMLHPFFIKRSSSSRVKILVMLIAKLRCLINFQFCFSYTSRYFFSYRLVIHFAFSTNWNHWQRWKRKRNLDTCSLVVWLFYTDFVVCGWCWEYTWWEEGSNKVQNSTMGETPFPPMVPFLWQQYCTPSKGDRIYQQSTLYLQQIR